ncbi:MAG: zf-TFIIB domain-containing protein, partial [Myxococcales bacterium]|nr:zf-TFIIB domain-containing protein [Myxococcales bacterium]
MRLIVACPACNRQYDASCYPVGSRFWCHCGAVCNVEQPPAHEAAVVRCSGCGAPRGDGPDCRHCGSSFARYELDLSSICPHCTTRVSDAARFCHSCGLALAAEGSAGELSPYVCPSCDGGQHMHSRALGKDLSLLECSRCAGVWLGRQTFDHVIRRAEEMLTQLPTQAGATPGGDRTVAQAKAVRYRPCPECKALMNRSQYGKFSRVIVDSCKEHGVWLDEGELTQILEWVRSGGLERARAAQHEQRKAELRQAEQSSRYSQARESWSGGDH